MAFTRANYLAMAAALSGCKPSGEGPDKAQWRSSVTAVTNVLDDDNDDFDRGAFEAACGVEGAVSSKALEDSGENITPDNDLVEPNLEVEKKTAQVALNFPDAPTFSAFMDAMHKARVPGSFVGSRVNMIESRGVRLQITTIMGHNPSYASGDEFIQAAPVLAVTSPVVAAS